MWGKVSCLRKQHNGRDWASNQSGEKRGHTRSGLTVWVCILNSYNNPGMSSMKISFLSLFFHRSDKAISRFLFF